VHEWLREQHHLLVELAQAAIDHLFDDVGGLARLFRLLNQDAALALDQRLVEAAYLDALRIGEGDVHGELAAEGLQPLGRSGRLERDDDADLAKAGCDRIVHVACDDTFRRREIGGAAQSHVLADRGDHFLDRLGDCYLAASVFGVGELIDIALGLDCGRGNLAHHLLEFLVASDEVGLGIDLDKRRFLRLGGKADEPFGGNAAGLLSGLGEALGPEPIDGGFHIAARLVQRRLAIHHARAGLLAQVLNHGCGNRGHTCLCRSRSRNGLRAASS
jgi:hypothetical protein